MRLWVVALLVLLPFASAFTVQTTGQQGKNPVLYGDIMVYERDGSIYAYDIPRHEEKEISKGANPSLFAFTAVFETKESDIDLNEDGDKEDTIIQFANVRDGKLTNTRAVGHYPAVFSSLIVFSTKESELGIDYSNDGDMGDDIIREYDIDKKEAINTKAVGNYPALNQRALIFTTDENQVGTDLNADNDKSDSILRILDKETNQVSNGKIAAIRPVLAKSEFAVFSSDGKIVLFDAVQHKAENTGVQGVSPALFDEVVVFERDGQLYGLEAETQRTAKFGILGSNPSLFEDTLAFIGADNNIQFAFEEDVDGDDVYDFTDNCPKVVNSDQADSNQNGVGDACDVKPKEEVKQELPKAEQQQNITQPPLPESKGIPWYVYLIAIILLPFAAHYGYKYYKKRQKSFGF